MAQQTTAGTIDLGGEAARKKARPLLLEVGRRLVTDKPIGLFGGILVHQTWDPRWNRLYGRP